MNVQNNGNSGDVKSLDTYRAVVLYMVYNAQPVADGRPQGKTTQALRTPCVRALDRLARRMPIGSTVTPRADERSLVPLVDSARLMRVLGWLATYPPLVPSRRGPFALMLAGTCLTTGLAEYPLGAPSRRGAAAI